MAVIQQLRPEYYGGYKITFVEGESRYGKYVTAFAIKASETITARRSTKEEVMQEMRARIDAKSGSMIRKIKVFRKKYSFVNPFKRINNR